MDNLKLYYNPSCPYCKKVLKYMDDNNITDIELLDITQNDEYKEELEKEGGKYQVPCLYINGKYLYESNDIIDYLKENTNK